MNLRHVRPLALALLGMALVMPQAKATFIKPVAGFQNVANVPIDPLGLTDLTLITQSGPVSVVSSGPDNPVSFDLYSFVWKQGATSPFPGKYAFGWFVKLTALNPVYGDQITTVSFQNFSLISGIGADVTKYNGNTGGQAPNFDANGNVPAGLTIGAAWNPISGPSQGANLRFTITAAANGIDTVGETTPLFIFRTPAASYSGAGQAQVSFDVGGGSGTTNSPQVSFRPSSVPEPTSLVLALVGLPLLGAYGLRRRARA